MAFDLVYYQRVSHVHRLRNTDRIFFLTVNLRRVVPPFEAEDYPLLTAALEGAGLAQGSNP